MRAAIISKSISASLNEECSIFKVSDSKEIPTCPGRFTENRPRNLIQFRISYFGCVVLALKRYVCTRQLPNRRNSIEDTFSCSIFDNDINSFSTLMYFLFLLRMKQVWEEDELYRADHKAVILRGPLAPRSDVSECLN